MSVADAAPFEADVRKHVAGILLENPVSLHWKIKEWYAEIRKLKYGSNDVESEDSDELLLPKSVLKNIIFEEGEQYVEMTQSQSEAMQATDADSGDGK